jgi:hypothetical protein
MDDFEILKLGVKSFGKHGADLENYDAIFYHLVANLFAKIYKSVLS